MADMLGRESGLVRDRHGSIEFARSYTARRDVTNYAIPVVVMVILLISWFHGELDGWVWSAVGLLLLAVGLMPVLEILLGKREYWGSHLDAVNRRIVWWDGNEKAPEQVMAFDDLSEIVMTCVDDGEGSSLTVNFCSHDGQSHPVSYRCIPEPMEDWANAIISLAPHVRYNYRDLRKPEQ